MLSDHIVFWLRHRELPAFPDPFEMAIYEGECRLRWKLQRLRELIDAAEATREGMREVAERLSGVEG